MAAGGEKEVNARVVYWGIEGCGKSANLAAVYAKLRPDHRSEIRRVATPFDPTVSYEVLPIELGEIAGVRTRLQVTAAPAGPEQAPTRKQLLDRVDGVVLVLDSQAERRDENLASYEELRRALAAYGRRLDTMPLVVQYNKRDLGDPYVIESLHRQLEVGHAPVFEAVASEGTGVLQTLSTISKRVIRSLRERERDDLLEASAPDAAAAEPSAPPPEPEPMALEPEPAAVELEPEPTLLEEPGPAAPLLEAEPTDLMEQAILAEESAPGALETSQEVETTLEAPGWDEIEAEMQAGSGGNGSGTARDFSIVSVGQAEQDGERRVRVPLVLGDSSGQTTGVAITIELAPLIEETS